MRVFSIPYNDNLPTEINEWCYDDYGNVLRDFLALEEYLSVRKNDWSHGFRLEIYDKHSLVHYKEKVWDYDSEEYCITETVTPFTDVLETWKHGNYGFEEMEIVYNTHPFQYSNYPAESYNI